MENLFFSWENDFRLITAASLLNQELCSSTSDFPFFFPFGAWWARPDHSHRRRLRLLLDNRCRQSLCASLIEATFDLHRHLLYKPYTENFPKIPKKNAASANNSPTISGLAKSSNKSNISFDICPHSLYQQPIQ
jgi:hypothetical protein